METRKETSEQLGTPSKYKGLRATITAELMTGFWFSVGVMSAIGIANGLNHFIGALTRGK